MIPDQIQDGFVPLAQPCNVKWEDMSPVAERQRHCLACDKVIHRIDGMRREEIYALLMSDPGNVCVNYRVIRLPETTAEKRRQPVPRGRMLRFAASAAAMLAILQQPLAAPLAWTPVPMELAPTQAQADSLSNTLLSGMVVDQHGNVVPEEIEIYVYCDSGQEIARMVTRGGMFAIDLAGLASPSEHIRVSAAPGPLSSSQVSTKADSLAPILSINPTLWVGPFYEGASPWGYGGYVPASWRGGSMDVQLGQAQNVQFVIDYTPRQEPMIMQMGGVPPIFSQVTLDFSMFSVTEVMVSAQGKPSRQEPDCTRGR